MEQKAYLGFDLGASSGRAMLGYLEGEKLTIREIHRFPNDPVKLAGELVWDFPRLFHEMKQALLKISRGGIGLRSIGIDTWGCDFGLLDASGHLISLPVHYRDARNNEDVMRRALSRLPEEEFYKLTGSAFRPFNTAMQLYSMRLRGDPRLDWAERLLFMPDLLAWCLTGAAGVEYTMATTSQLLDPGTGRWSREVFERLDLPEKLLPEPPERTGSLRGTLLRDLAEECGVERVSVYAVGSHDTASAVAAVPSEEDSFAFLSSGTVSLIGAVVPRPVFTRDAMLGDCTNEGCIDGSIRLLNNIVGLWVLQECRREWERRGQAPDFAELVELARREPPYRSVIDIGDPRFYPPGDMPARIRQYCRETGQAEPQTPGAVTRAVCESLALQYRIAMEALEERVLKRRFDVLHIVGGGSRNRMLDQFTANCLGRPVIAGPAEATVIGNLLTQALAAGELEDAAAIRRVVRASFGTERYEPLPDPGQEEACALMRRLMDRRTSEA
ncbi:MAG: rhamnulokinase [Clostridia bacterium]|nr:rhamnulokinase [Clostridia bacterium]